MKILVAEDKREERYLLETLLKGEGFDVTSVSNGEEALEKLRLEHFNLILSDILMPKMDGFKLCQICNENPDLKDIPFVFCTATYTDSQDEELASRLGAEGFIRKPVENEEITRVIRNLLQKKEKTELRISTGLPDQEREILKLYNERLVKKLEQKMIELRIEEERYRRLCENVNDLVFSLDENGFFTQVNCRTELFGYVPEDVLGKHFSELLTQRSKRRGAQYFERAKRGESRRDVYEIEIKRKDGTVGAGELSVSTVYEGEKFLGRYGIVRDISRRKQAENKLRRSEIQLRHLAAHLQTVREEERRSISRELHDVLGQTLTSLKIDLTSIHRNLGDGPDIPEIVKQKMGGIFELIEESIMTVRRISGDLRPAMLDDLGLITAVEWQVKEFRDRTGIQCDFKSSIPQIDFHGDFSIALFRIIQESLTNIARHARATRAEVLMSQKKDRLFVEIKDDGTGITRKRASDSNSFGIIGMRERVHALSGTFSISGIHGKGTRVRVTVPLIK